jgi:hypothetical protein
MTGPPIWKLPAGISTKSGDESHEGSANFAERDPVETTRLAQPSRFQHNWLGHQAQNQRKCVGNDTSFGRGNRLRGGKRHIVWQGEPARGWETTRRLAGGTGSGVGNDTSFGRGKRLRGGKRHVVWQDETGPGWQTTCRLAGASGSGVGNDTSFGRANRLRGGKRHVV